MTYDYAKLQNGSDIRGVASPVLGNTVNLDAEAAGRLARGFCYLLNVRDGVPFDGMTVAVGRDSRVTGPELAEAVCSALSSCGIKVFDCGMASTPAMFMSTVFPEYDADGAIMITASHMPMDRNGLKFFGRGGGLEKRDITDIINFAESNSILGQLPRGAGPVEKRDLIDTYSAHLRDLICEGVASALQTPLSCMLGPSIVNPGLPPFDPDKPLAGLRITVDAGNGAGGFYAGKVLEPLGADVSSSRFLEPDGTFPNHIPNPENREAMDSIREAVNAAGTDLGIIFDTDVDRASAVDETGREIAHNGIVAMAAALIADDHPGTTVVTDSVTSRHLTEFLEKDLGLKHLRYKRGYRNVIGKSIELNEQGIDSELAIETSGHAAYRENYFLDDGAYLATRIVIKTALLKARGKGISSVVANLAEAAESKEARLPISGEDFGETAGRMIAEVTNLVASGNLKGCTLEEPNYEGVRINFNAPSIRGWMLLRKSLHDPIIPVNMEADVPGGVAEMVRIITPILMGYPEIDISKL
ncbi:MAG: phosphomannomutase/phosphoglucomutase [Firmicutes bacterium]|nr:phosphomannomutase/phosphoglucomutase [Bacillota bacterium]